MIEVITQKLLENGVLAVILAWFMFRIEKHLKANNELLAIIKDKIKR